MEPNLKYFRISKIDMEPPTDLTPAERYLLKKRQKYWENRDTISARNLAHYYEKKQEKIDAGEIPKRTVGRPRKDDKYTYRGTITV